VDIEADIPPNTRIFL